jgi:hypothetical protein
MTKSLQPGPAENREMQALIFDLMAVMKKHKHMKKMRTAGAFMMTTELFKELIAESPKEKEHILKFFYNSTVLVGKAIETGTPLFNEEIDR